MNYIYVIRNKVNNKVYVGRTNDPGRRRGQHFNDLKRGCHENDKLQKAYDKYGRENFEYLVIDEAPAGKIGDLEIQYIKNYSSIENGYNITPGGDGALIGEDNLMSKLTVRNVYEIKHLIQYTKYSFQEISEMYNVSRPTISNINLLKSWNDVYPEFTPRVQGVDEKLTPETMEVIKNLRLEKKTTKEITALTGLSQMTLTKAYKELGFSGAIRKGQNGKLTQEQRNEIKELILRGEISQRKIAELYNVSPAAITLIKKEI